MKKLSKEIFYTYSGGTFSKNHLRKNKIFVTDSTGVVTIANILTGSIRNLEIFMLRWMSL